MSKKFVKSKMKLNKISALKVSNENILRNSTFFSFFLRKRLLEIDALNSKNKSVLGKALIREQTFPSQMKMIEC